jgi:circadian clock protein KaiB
MSPPNKKLAEYEKALSNRSDDIYVLRLYVTGMSSISIQAIANLKRVCEEHLAGRYELEVIDLHQQPALAAAAQLVVAPTLVKQHPLPVRKLIGTMANAQDVLRSLDVPTSRGMHTP